MNNGDTSSEQLDDELLAELRATVDAVDPVPDRLIDGAKAAFAWRTIDEDLARLQFDSLAESDLAAVRSTRTIHLAFATSEAGIDVEIGADTLTGQVVPPAVSVGIMLRSGERVDVSCDEQGQFTIPRPSSGPVRLVAVFDHGEVVTEWFTVG